MRVTLDMRAVLAVFAVVLLASVAQAQFVPLGDLGGGDFDSAAWGVSANGLYVVGDGATDGGTQGFRYDVASGQMIPLEVRPLPHDDEYATSHGRARAISNDGNIIGGWVALLDSGDYTADGAIWDAGGNLTIYSAGPSFADSDGGGISDLTPDGTVGAAWSRNLGNNIEYPQPIIGNWQTRTSFWTAAGGIDERGADSPIETMALSISSDGTVVAGTRGQETLFPYTAMRYSDASGTTDLGYLARAPRASTENAPFFLPVYLSPNQIYSQARGISPDGSQLVGWTSSSEGFDAFFWEVEGNGMLALGDLGAGEDVASSAYAISSTGVVVGTADRGSERSNRIFEAFVYDEENGMVSLEDMLTGRGYDLGGYELIAAYDISPNGNFIVGEAINPQGEPEAFFVSLPEPSGGSLVILGILGFLRRRGRGALKRS